MEGMLEFSLASLCISSQAEKTLVFQGFDVLALIIQLRSQAGQVAVTSNLIGVFDLNNIKMKS